MKVVTIREGANIKIVVQADNAGGGGGGDDSFDGDRIITAEVDGFEGENVGGTTIKTFLNNAFFPAEPPTASMTLTMDSSTSGSNRTKQFDAGSTENATINWTAGRAATSLSITSITADGIAQTFTDPAQGATTNGNQAVTFSSNTNRTLQTVVTTSDGKTASDSVTVYYRWEQYLGFTATQSPNDATIQALDSSFITSEPSFDGTVVNGGGSQYFAIVFPESLEPIGGVTIKLGGFDITSDFTRSTFTFTNTSGGSSTHVLLISNNQTSGNYTDLEIIS